MRLWEEVGTQLKGVTEAMKELALEMRDVRERLIRIEAQDQPKKLASLEEDLRETQDEIARVEKDAADDLARATAVHHQEIGLIKSQATADIARVEKTASDDKLALEKRLTRMEMIIAPLTCAGGALLATIITILVQKFTGS
ncbi:hypothetical protein HOU00_gp471 [Caulobacter phage CcrPW]|uniref:Uncharacterized protein n=1 Tax=Caulobacter phage CcrPW TaxID=2283271 RepID=A0A385E9X3_9CAUD|nr:hypothetical protein HOU00_gp471 [Caulobacter phage CcrPW]AXQ68654.1 hypothetical protein CcrPW_gp115 [Caulobacter phage CcrPW]